MNLPVSPLTVLIVLIQAVQNPMGMIVSIAVEASHSIPFMLMLLSFSMGRSVALALFLLELRTRVERMESRQLSIVRKQDNMRTQVNSIQDTQSSMLVRVERMESRQLSIVRKQDNMRTQVNSIQDTQSSMLVRLRSMARRQSSIGRKQDYFDEQLLMTTAKKQCDKFQVEIVITCHGRVETKGGYGVVLWRDGAAYLKSCYHVFLDARLAFGDITSEKVKTTITFLNRPALPIRLNDVFIPSRLAEYLHYIDIALYSFDIVGYRGVVVDHENVNAATTSLQGRKVLASSKTRMEGSANELKDPYNDLDEYGNPIETWCELLVNATSMPGCSGSPMFDVYGDFIGLIKGSAGARSADFSLSEGNAQASCLGVSSTGLEFIMVKKEQQHILDGLIRFKRDKSVGTILREHLEKCLITDCGAVPIDAEVMLEEYQKDLVAMHCLDQDSIHFHIGHPLQLVKSWNYM